MADFTIRALDRHPVLVATLANEDGSVVDLTSATAVHLLYRRRDAQTVTTKSMAVDSPATAGKARYAWVAGDTDAADIGSYWAVVRVTWADGTQSYPNPDLLSIDVSADLASLPVISDGDLAVIRGFVGSTPSDIDLASALARLGTAEAVALEVIGTRLADLLAGGLKYDIDGDVSVDDTKLAEAWAAIRDDLRATVDSQSGAAPTPWAGGLTWSERDDQDPDLVGPYFTETFTPDVDARSR